jgi:hypothetical protein
MESQELGAQHGEAVRRTTGFAATVALALAKDVILNALRVRGYLAGFAQGLLSPRSSCPNG